MAQHLIYHWKHGWIPLTHAAALSKAHGNAKLADKYVPGASAHHASRPTAGKSAREIHGGLEAHTLTHGTAATVHGMNEHGITTSFAGRVTGAPRKVRIKEGPHGKPQEHVAVSMHNGSDNSGNDATAHATMYVPTASPDAGVSDAHRYTPEKGAAAAAALQSAHEARTPSFTPGQKLIASGIGSPGDRPVTYVGLDHNGNHQVRGSVNGQLVTQSVSASTVGKLRPAEISAPPTVQGARGTRITVGEHVSYADDAHSKVRAVEYNATTGKVRIQNDFQTGAQGTWVSPVQLVPYGQGRGEPPRAGGLTNPDTGHTRGLPARRRETPDDAYGMKLAKPELAPTPAPAAEHRPTAAPSAAARATVDHSGDGTLLSIERSDTAAREAAKAAGFRWSGALGSWYLPRNWSESTRRQKVAQLQQTLGHGTVHLNDSGPGATTTAAEREAAARAHAADRAGRMDARAQRASAEADRRFGAAQQISDGIPMGQPILVGHHSQRRHERDIARIHSNMGKGVEAMQEAERAQASAENARRTVAGDSPLLRLRRIERNQAELRKIDRTLAEHSTAQKIIGGEKYNAASPSVRATVDRMLQPSDHHARLTAMRTQLADEIAHDQAQVEASGHKTISAADIKAGDVIHYRGRGHIVKKVNKTTVSVPTGYSWDDKVPVHQIQRHTKVTDMSESTLRAGVDNKTLDPKVREVYRRELKRRGVTL